MRLARNIWRLMMDREKAVERCSGCKYCHPFKDWDNCQYLACQVCANKWIVEVEQCPMEDLKG
jgi:hypothetical protein